jgi:gamma-glutamylcyclotransferase (GGCT)/AIG2-like uncharacterized protein YtfP
MNQNHRYAFYGSLRRGLSNYARFGHAFEFISTERIPGFRMYALNHYPYAVFSGDSSDTIVAEIMIIKDPATELDLHEFELSVGYDYQEIEFRGSTLGIYVYKNPGNHPRVLDGDWVNFFCR